jgi:hypothetical protein
MCVRRTVLIAVTTVRTVCPCVVGVVAVAARMFSEEQLEQLRSFPDIGRDDLIRYFTLTQADMAFVDPGRGRGPADRLGLAVQLCTNPRHRPAGRRDQRRFVARYVVMAGT